jgi:methanethiol S-methyltransferase
MGTTFMERSFVWCGGALFVGSLSLTAWLYGVALGRSRPAGGWTPLLADVVLLSLFALHHSAFAREPVKKQLRALVPARLLRSVYVWVASLLLIALDLLWQPVGGDFYRVEGWFAGPFAIVQLTGVWLIARSVRAINALELAGIREPNASEGELQTGGVYRLVRHPLYFGWVLIVFGTAHVTGDRLAFAVLTTIYLLIAMPWEERSLEREFGPAYQRYKERVRWRIVPYVY